VKLFEISQGVGVHGEGASAKEGGASFPIESFPAQSYGSADTISIAFFSVVGLLALHDLFPEAGSMAFAPTAQALEGKRGCRLFVLLASAGRGEKNAFGHH
jgi:hypothetical protein